MPQPPWITFGRTKPSAPEPEPQGKNLWEKIRDLGAGVGDWADRQIGQELLSRSNPGLYRSQVRRMQGGESIPASEVYREVRKVLTPGWSKASAQDRAAAMMLTGMEAPASWALGALGSLVGGRLGGGIGAAAGGGLGRLTGAGIARTMANVANPEAAGRNVLWDVAGLAGGKALGTLGSMKYRQSLQPMLARSHPRAERILSQVESALDPLTGPAARNYGLPRWANRRLQRLGPQGVAPMGPRTPIPALYRQLPSGSAQPTLPGGTAQQMIPGGQPQRLLPAPASAPGLSRGGGHLLPGRVPPFGQQDLELPGVAQQQGLGLPRMRPFRPTRLEGPPLQPGSQMDLGLPQPTFQQGIPGIGRATALRYKPSPAAPTNPKNIRELIQHLPPEAEEIPLIHQFAQESKATAPDPLRELRQVLTANRDVAPANLLGTPRFEKGVPLKPPAPPEPPAPPVAAKPKPKPKPPAPPKAPKPKPVPKTEAPSQKREPWVLKTDRDKLNVQKKGYIRSIHGAEASALERIPKSQWTPEQVLGMHMSSNYPNRISKVTAKSATYGSGRKIAFRNRHGVIQLPEFKEHKQAVERALFYRKPVSAEAVEFYDMVLPSGYKKQGSTYVFDESLFKKSSGNKGPAPVRRVEEPTADSEPFKPGSLREGKDIVREALADVRPSTRESFRLSLSQLEWQVRHGRSAMSDLRLRDAFFRAVFGKREGPGPIVSLSDTQIMNLRRLAKARRWDEFWSQAKKYDQAVVTAAEKRRRLRG